MEENTNKSISIIIPNWNGKNLLERFLPTVVDASNCYDGDSEIIVVDDGSNDDSVIFLRNHFPSVKTVTLYRNQGFAAACNAGLAHCSKELIVFLNNDMAVSKDFLKPVSKHFYDKKIFGVRLGIKWLTEEGMKTDLSHLFISIRFRFGLIECPMLTLKEPLYPFYCIAASGGAGVFDREKLLHLKGFDEMFSPFYWEDFDLSYRAWKRGWIVVFEPESIVYHQPSSTISLHKEKSLIRKIGERNRYLLVWKNINDPSFILKHLLFIPFRVLRNLYKYNLIEILALAEALKFFSIIIEKRKIEKRESIIKDKEIFQFFKSLALNADTRS